MRRIRADQIQVGDRLAEGLTAGTVTAVCANALLEIVLELGDTLPGAPARVRLRNNHKVRVETMEDQGQPKFWEGL